MKTILIDDEPMALQVLENMLLPYKDINIVGRYTRPSESLESIKLVEPDIIFLDIEMGDMNGLELAEIFMEKLDNVEIVFVTAYSEYAVEAFEINAIDYLLKPIQEKRLVKAIERLRKKTKNHLLKRDTNNLDNRLKVYSFGGFQVLDSMGNPLKWRTQKAKELFAYLWERKDGPVSKSRIMEDVFPNRELDKAATILHTTIYQLRKSLRQLGYPNAITYFDESYQLNIPIGSDLEQFKRLISFKTHNNQQIKELLEIYKGDFLEEGYIWGVESQQMYREVILNKIENFAKNQLQEEKIDLILKASLNKAFEMDSFNGILAEMMIRYYGIQNKKSNLESFYNYYVKNLREEMNLEPGGNITNIYNKYMKV